MRAGKRWILAPALPVTQVTYICIAYTWAPPWAGPAFPPGAQSLFQAMTCISAALTLQVLKKHWDVVLRDVAHWETTAVGGWLDWMILEVFSNLGDSMTTGCCFIFPSYMYLSKIHSTSTADHSELKTHALERQSNKLRQLGQRWYLLWSQNLKPKLVNVQLFSISFLSFYLSFLTEEQVCVLNRMSVPWWNLHLYKQLRRFSCTSFSPVTSDISVLKWKKIHRYTLVHNATQEDSSSFASAYFRKRWSSNIAITVPRNTISTGKNHRTAGVGVSLWRCSPIFLLKKESVTEGCPGLHPVRFWASPQLHWGTHPSVQPPLHSKNQNRPKTFKHSRPNLKSSSTSTRTSELQKHVRWGPHKDSSLTSGTAWAV